jgi:predicted ATP-dependent endonuclease of OLD family
MRYTAFHFKNFKGIEEMTLDLTGAVTTLIGLNESGKTTILEAVFCFSYGAEDLEVINPEMAALRVPDKWIPISKRANFNDTVEICAVVELNSEDRAALQKHIRKEFGLRLSELPETIEICERHVFENSRFKKTNHTWDLEIAGTRGRERNPRRYAAKSDEWQGAVAYLKEQLPRIWYFPNFLFELPERFSLSETALVAGDEEQAKSQFYRSTFEQILAELGSGANLQTHIVERVQSDERADQRSLSALLLDMGRVITNTIFEGWDRIFGSRPAAQEVELEAEADSGETFLELRIKGPDGYYDLSERSLGFRWFFMFLLMTSFHGLNEDGPKALFLLDEPASNLHSTAQAELLKSFKNLVQKCDLVYTTHSHHLIDVRWLDSAYVVKNAALGSLDFADYVTQRMGANTSISATPYRRFVAENPEQTSYFQPVLDLLDYRPSVLEPVPDVVLVEGKSDFYLLRYASEILGLHDMKLVPGGGASTLEPLIRLHVGWAKSFVVLLDGDKEGHKQKQRYETEFGPTIQGRCVLLPDVCGDASVREVEDLLADVDKAALIQAVFGTTAGTPRPKKALGQAILELYARRESVSLSSESTERVQTLFNQVDEMLRGQLETAEDLQAGTDTADA